MTDQPIHVTLASDDNYARHMGIVVFSLLSNSAQPERLEFHFLDAGIAPKNRQHIESIVQAHGASCEFICPDGDIYDDIPKKRYGVAALFRLSLGTLLPAEITRVIYLDCDVLAFGDIADLWQQDLGDKTIGAVTNLGVQSEKRLGVPDGEYFNSGVLLIDLTKWREQHIGERTLALMQQDTQRLIFPDQDGLNCVLQGKWQHLPLRWNQQPATYSMYEKGKTERGLTSDQFREAISNPAIVHYLGRNKPWNYMTFHPLKENYWAYLARSPWHDSRTDNISFPNRIRKALQLEKNLKRLRRRLATPAAIRLKGFTTS